MMNLAETTASGLDGRAERVLRELILRYLRDGAPVSSRALSGLPNIDCSPATVRNVMADLEDIGFLVSPHTSAGRVPSARGIRFFVDRLIRLTPPPRGVARRLRDGLRADTAADARRAGAEIVSQLTRYAGFVSEPGESAPAARQLRFVKLSSSRVLAIIVTTEGDIINRVFAHDRDPSESDLAAAAAAYNRHFSGMTFDAAKTALRGQMVELRERISALLRALLRRMEGDGADGGELRLAGEMNLLREGDLSADMDQLRELYGLLARKKDLLALLARGGKAKNVRVFIGGECGLSPLEECSVVFSPCPGEGGGSLGVIGVIGPKRMRYNEVIPTVDIAAKLLGGMLEELRRGG